MLMSISWLLKAQDRDIQTIKNKSFYWGICVISGPITPLKNKTQYKTEQQQNNNTEREISRIERLILFYIAQ